MFIENLTIENYGALKNAMLEFQKGFNILSGSNGAGKSHIIRALAYLILNHNEGKIEDDLNWHSNSFTIQTKIKYGGKDFIIKNHYDGKNVLKELIISSNGNKQQYSGNKDVVDVLSQYFDPTYSKPALIAFQGEMDVVTATPAKRRESLKNIYDLNFQKEIQQLEDEKTSLELKVQELEKQIAILESKSYNLYKKERLPFNENTYKEKETDVKKLQSKKQSLENEINDFESKLQNVNRFKSFYESKEREIKELLDKKDILQSKINELKNVITNPNYNVVDKLKKQIDDIKLERIKEDFDINVLNSKKEKLYEEKNELKNIKKNIELVEMGKCPTCGADFSNVDINDYKRRYEEKEEIVSAINKEIEAIEKDYKTWQEKKKKNDRKKELKNNLINQLKYEEKKIEDVINSSKESLEERSNELVNVNKKIEDYAEEKEVLKKDLQKELDQLPDEADIESKNKQIEDIKNKIDLISREIEEYRTVLNKNKWIEEENKKILKQKDEDEKLKQKINKDHDHLLKEVNEYKKSVDILKKDFPNYIINELKSDIETGMNEILDKAYNGRYHVQIKENRSGLSIVYGNDKEIKLASGAEKNLFTIGFKNAFTRLAGLKVLLLDECDNFMDEDIAKKTFDVLQNLIEQEALNQVILITHKQSVKELLEGDYRARVFEVKNGGAFLLE